MLKLNKLFRRILYTLLRDVQEKFHEQKNTYCSTVPYNSNMDDDWMTLHLFDLLHHPRDTNNTTRCWDGHGHCSTSTMIALVTLLNRSLQVSKREQRVKSDDIRSMREEGGNGRSAADELGLSSSCNVVHFANNDATQRFSCRKLLQWDWSQVLDNLTSWALVIVHVFDVVKSVALTHTTRLWWFVLSDWRLGNNTDTVTSFGDNAPSSFCTCIVPYRYSHLNCNLLNLQSPAL